MRSFRLLLDAAVRTARQSPLPVEHARRSQQSHLLAVVMYVLSVPMASIALVAPFHEKM